MSDQPSEPEQDFNAELEASEDDTVQEVEPADLDELSEYLEKTGREFEASEDYDDEPNETLPDEED